MGIYARHTKVSYKKTLKEIEHILFKYGVRKMNCQEDREKGRATLTFKVDKRTVRFNAPLPKPTDDNIVYTPSMKHERDERLQRRFYIQAINQRWRAMALAIKSRFVRLEDKVISFDEEFLGNIVFANGKTLTEMVAPHVDSMTKNGELAAKLELPFANIKSIKALTSELHHN